MRIQKLGAATAHHAVTAVVDQTCELDADVVDQPVVSVSRTEGDGPGQFGEVEIVAGLEHVGEHQFRAVLNAFFLLHGRAGNGDTAAGDA